MRFELHGELDVTTVAELTRPLLDAEGVIPALIILLREIIVSGLREFLASLQVSVPVSTLAKWKTTLQLASLGALILAGALPQWPWVFLLGLASLWSAAVLTSVQSCPGRRASVACDERTTDAVGNSYSPLMLPD